MKDYNRIVEGDMNFGEWLQGLFEEHGITSSRQGRIRTGISHTTLEEIIRGRQPSVESVVRIAKGFHEDPIYALRLAGHNDVAEMLEEGREEPETRLEGSSGGSGEYHSDDIPPELQQVWSFQGKVYNELPPGKARDLYLESLRANAQSMRELVSVRLKAEAVAEVRAPYTTEEK